MINKKALDALTMAALVTGDAALEMEEAGEDEANAEISNMRDRLEYWREQLAEVNDLAEDHREEYTLERMAGR